MPYGKGAFEGEPASTFLLNAISLDGGADDSKGSCDETGFYSVLFDGPVTLEDIFEPDLLRAKDAGYTAEEIDSALERMANMAGAILTETDQGFVHGETFDSIPTLKQVWRTSK